MGGAGRQGREGRDLLRIILFTTWPLFITTITNGARAQPVKQSGVAVPGKRLLGRRRTARMQEAAQEGQPTGA
jgi:hypothetical protein